MATTCWHATTAPNQGVKKALVKNMNNRTLNMLVEEVAQQTQVSGVRLASLKALERAKALAFMPVVAAESSVGHALDKGQFLYFEGRLPGLKVLVLTQDFRGGGGAEKFIANLSLALRDQVDFTFVYPVVPNPGDHQFPYHGKLNPLDLQSIQPAGRPDQKAARLARRLSISQGSSAESSQTWYSLISASSGTTWP